LARLSRAIVTSGLSISSRRAGEPFITTALEVDFGFGEFTESVTKLAGFSPTVVKRATDAYGLLTYVACGFGVGVIAAKYVSVRRKGGDVKLLRLSPRSQRVMRISGLLKIFESFENEDEALNSFAAARNQAAG